MEIRQSQFVTKTQFLSYFQSDSVEEARLVSGLIDKYVNLANQRLDLTQQLMQSIHKPEIRSYTTAHVVYTQTRDQILHNSSCSLYTNKRLGLTQQLLYVIVQYTQFYSNKSFTLPRQTVPNLAMVYHALPHKTPAICTSRPHVY